MDIEKINLKSKNVGWSDKVGQSFEHSIKGEVDRYNKTVDQVVEEFSKVVTYDSNTLEYHSQREIIDRLTAR